MVMGTDLHLKRKEMGIGDDAPGDGFVFDVFHCLEDMERVEKHFGIHFPSLNDRALGILAKLDKKMYEEYLEEQNK